MKHILLFCRYPELGQVKSRLAASCGQKKALLLYEKMLSTLLANLDKSDFELRIHYTGCDQETTKSWLPGRSLFEQVQGDLGERLIHGAKRSFEDGADEILLIGADCPEIDKKVCEEAFARLAETDLVLGPATDGGYYLLGIKKLYEGLFRDISWGTSGVRSQTESAAKELNLKLFLMDEKQDMDFWEDIPKNWKEDVEQI